MLEQDCSRGGSSGGECWGILLQAGRGLKSKLASMVSEQGLTVHRVAVGEGPCSKKLPGNREGSGKLAWMCGLEDRKLIHS